MPESQESIAFPIRNLCEFYIIKSEGVATEEK